MSKHILPFFGRIPVVQITDKHCQDFRAKLFADRDRLLKIFEAGGRPINKNGRPRKPLSLRSIQMMVGLLAQILDDAVADKLRGDNPARSKRLRVRVPKPDRTFLEIDQLVALLDAAGELEAAPRSAKRAKLTATQVEEIRVRLARGETQYAVRLEYGLSSGAMSMLAKWQDLPWGQRPGRLACALRHAWLRRSSNLRGVGPSRARRAPPRPRRLAAVGRR